LRASRAAGVITFRSKVWSSLILLLSWWAYSAAAELL